MRKAEETVTKYAYFVEYDKEDDVFVAKCAEFPDIAAHGKSQEKALTEVRKAILESIKWMAEEGEEIPEPFSLHRFSGEFRVRMPPEKHRKIAMEAALQGISMNRFIVNKL